MTLLLHLPSHRIPLACLLLTVLLSRASATSTTETAKAVETGGFWLGFALVFVVSAIESTASIIWIRYRVTSDGIHTCELSYRVCGREINLTTVDPETARIIATQGVHQGISCKSRESVMVVNSFGLESSRIESGSGCGCCCGWERMHIERHSGAMEAVSDSFGSLSLVPTLLIRRFNCATALTAPAGVVDNVRKSWGFVQGTISIGRALEHVIHIFASLTDLSLGVAGLALNPGSPQKLYDTIRDPAAPLTFENYLTMSLLFWFLGALLLACTIPMRRETRSIQLFGWPRKMAQVVGILVNVALFGLGCWKIDYARRQDLPWTPVLSYWIGGASAISVTVFGFEDFVIHVFGVVGLAFMVKDVFEGS